MNRLTALFVFAALVSLATGCASRPTTDVVATTGMIADAAKRIGGDRVRVECLMGPGVDPHKFVATPGHLTQFASAKLILYNGLHLEGKMSDVLEQSLGAKAVAVTKNLNHAKLRAAEVDGGVHDPHVWFDVALWAECVKTIRDEMAARFPEHADHFRTNANAYLKELADLDAEVREKADKLPKDRRVLVTSHDAFGYFGAAYGFEVHGLQGVSTAGESGTNDVTLLADLIREKRVRAVFTETSVPSRGLQQVLDAVRKGANGYEVKLVGDADALYSDALGEPGKPGESYTGMVRHNIDVIVNALGK